jgi:UDP-N-acetylmuramyl pentapeptide phosphotransferase/UDP-N-acetylglucosamine-1-phosphate transferase
MIERLIERLLILGPTALAALLLSLGLMVLVRPWLAHHALAHPNARSSHRQPTPQGGGIAVVAATLLVAWIAVALSPALLQNQGKEFLAVTIAAVLLAAVGALDDLRSLPTAARLAAQCIAVGAVTMSLPEALRVLPDAPLWIERVGLFLAGVWFVNLVNFMDGIDWMTVAELVPVTATIVLLGLCGAIPLLSALAAAALLGAILGFAPFNRPVAQIFLGDVGSLPIGLLLGWLLLQLVDKGHVAGAIILPLYYLADATITLARRVARGDPFWRAHRTHFYQRATDNGFPVSAVVARVLLLNIALGALALLSIAADRPAISVLAFAAGAGMVTWVLMIFARGRR